MSLEIENVPVTHEPVVSEGINPETGGIIDESLVTSGNNENNAEETTVESPKPTFDVPVYNLESFGLPQEVVDSISPTLDRFSNAGLTQDQLQVVMEEILGTNENVQEQTQVEPDYITTLNETLTIEEKRNYDNIKNFANNVYGGTGFDPDELMKDPYAVKMLNLAFMNTVAQPNQTLGTPVHATMGITPQEAQAEYISIMKKANTPTAQRNEKIKALIEKTGNSDWAKQKYSKFIK